MSFHLKPDLARKLTALAPFRVTTGRTIVDANGRVIARCIAGQTITDAGACHDIGLSPCEADANAHAIAAQLNLEPLSAALAECERLRDSAGADIVRIFWHRLAGSLRKAASL